jgi:hypothetical protein
MSSTEHLSEQQVARLEALQAARSVGSKTTGPLGTTSPPDIYDLVSLAEYIIHGTHPFDRYEEVSDEDSDASGDA